MQWFIMRNGQQAGPYTEDQIRTMLGTLELSSSDMAWREGMAAWSPISSALSASPPPGAVVSPPPFNAPPRMQPQAAFAAPPHLAMRPKSRAVYALLAIFLGTLGIHNFYAGYAGRGAAQLLLSIFSGGLLVWVPWIWAIFEAITVTKDSRGLAFA